MKEVDSIKSKIIPILKYHSVRKAGIFGSYARGEQKKRSDVDLLVEIDEKVSLFGLIELKMQLERKIGKKVDLVEYDLIRKEIKERILKEEIPILT